MKFTSQYFSLWCHPYCRGGRENFVKRKIMSSKVDFIYLGSKLPSYSGIWLVSLMMATTSDATKMMWNIWNIYWNICSSWGHSFEVIQSTVHNFILDTNWLVLTWTYTGCWAWQKGSPPPVLPTCVGNWDDDGDEDDDDEDYEDDEGPENMKSVQNQSF